MLEPRLPDNKCTRAEEGLKNWYRSIKDEYFELCWQYNLPPRDLSLFLMGKREIGSVDRIRLIRLVIQLIDLENLLSPGSVEDYLFPRDEAHYINSGIFPQQLH